MSSLICHFLLVSLNDIFFRSLGSSYTRKLSNHTCSNRTGHPALFSRSDSLHPYLTVVLQANFAKCTDVENAPPSTHPKGLTSRLHSSITTPPAIAGHAHLAYPLHPITRLSKPKDGPQTNPRPLPMFAPPLPWSRRL
jgi:hypothetical protein